MILHNKNQQSTKILKMNNFLEIESNPIDDLFGISIQNLDNQSEIDLSYLEQFASNTFSFSNELLQTDSQSDSVTIYEDKSEYKNELETGPISTLIEQREVHLEHSPTSVSTTSPSSAESNMSFGCSIQSPTSSFNGSSLHFPSPPPLTPISPTSIPSGYQSPSLYSNQKYLPTQRFFPLDFNPNQIHSDGHYHDYTSNSPQQQWSPADCDSFHLKPVPPVKAIRRSRASRSRCPCLKCCSARINGLSSPSQHLCIIKGCQKSYSRPAHLRNHLKTHQNQADLKCGICLRKFITSEMIISHMTDEHEADMKLF